MIAASFSFDRVNPTFGTSEGWAVYKHETGKEPVRVSEVFLTSKEAEAERDRIRYLIETAEWAEDA